MSNPEPRIAELEEAARLRMDRFKGTAHFLNASFEFARVQRALGYSDAEIQAAIAPYDGAKPHVMPEVPLAPKPAPSGARERHPVRAFGGY